MKKLSEILELAMPFYVEKIKERELLCSSTRPKGNMCFRIEELKTLDQEEVLRAKQAIATKLNSHRILADYLESKGCKTTALAQIRFYRQWIKELKAEGN